MMKVSTFLIFAIVVVVTECQNTFAQMAASDTTLEREMYAFASSRDNVEFGESGFRLCALPFLKGQSALVVYWDMIGDSGVPARLGFFEHQCLRDIETDQIVDMSAARTNEVYPETGVRDQVRESRHTFETREQYIPDEWKRLLIHLKASFELAGIESQDDFLTAWLIDLNLDEDPSTPDKLSLLIRRREDVGSFILVRPGVGVTNLDVVELNSTSTISGGEVTSALRQIPTKPFYYIALAVKPEVSWAAYLETPEANICYQLDSTRSQKLAALCNDNLPSKKSWTVIESRLADLKSKRVIRDEVTENEYCRWLIGNTGPRPRRLIDPAILLLP